MGKFSELDLKWWEEEDLEDLCEEYPNLESMSVEELNKLATSLYWEAQHLIDRANSIESKADTIRMYIRAIEK